MAAFLGQAIEPTDTQNTNALFTELWPIYLILRGQTANGLAGPNPVSLADMALYAQTFAPQFVAYKRLLMLDADALFLSAVAKKNASQTSKSQNPKP